MKTLTIVLASAMMLTSLNSFAGTCDPCIAAKINEDSLVLPQADLPRDSKVKELLQDMTVAVRQRIVNSPVKEQKKNSCGKKKANK